MGDFSRALEAIPDGVVVIDNECAIEFVNAEACRILETSSEAALSEPLERVLGGHPIVRLVRGVLASQRPAIEAEHLIERRLGEAALVDVAAAPIADADEKQDGAVLMLRDRTIQDSLRELVSQREALAAFGRIAAGIAHEVKNPLGGIRGAAEILASRAADGVAREAAELIVREVERISLLVDDFMVFAQGEELRCAPVNIHRVLDDVLDLAAMDPIAARASVRREFDPSIPELQADADRLVQVFLNLVRNALQALGEAGGELVITTRMTLDHRLTTSDGTQLPTLLVEVADDGPGIAPDVLDRLATPFFTTRDDGTGLGLALSRHWVARHGGTLRFDSEPGHGTTVRVALPLRRPA